MSTLLKITLIIHIVLAVLFGLPLLAAPGRFLGLFAWAPIDPLLSRVLGAALIGLGWLNFCALRQNSRAAAQPVIEAGLLFNGLAVAGLVRNMAGSSWPWVVWSLLGLFTVLTILWAVSHWKK